jgi:hypothetical protein
MIIVSRVVTVVLCGCLLWEGASTGLWIASRLPMWRAYDGIALAAVVARGAMAALQLAAGSLLWKRSPAGLAMAPTVFLGSAALYALELGAGLRPSSVYPGARWLLVTAYGGYAVAAAVVLVTVRRRE